MNNSIITTIFVAMMVTSGIAAAAMLSSLPLLPKTTIYKPAEGGIDGNTLYHDAASRRR